MAEDTAEAAGEMMEEGKEAAGDAIEAGKEMTGEAMEATGETIQDAGEAMEEKGKELTGRRGRRLGLLRTRYRLLKGNGRRHGRRFPFSSLLP